MLRQPFLLPVVGSAVATQAVADADEDPNSVWCRHLVLAFALVWVSAVRCVGGLCRLWPPQGMSRCKFTFPPLFSMLLSPQNEAVSLGLRLAKEAWGTISAADVQAKVNPTVKSALAAVTWAGDLFVREVLVLLAQHRFEFVCPPARTMISDGFDGCMQTAVCENANGACRDRQRDNKNLKMSRLSRYMFPVTRGVLEEFRFPEVSISEAALVAPTSERSLPDNCFSAGGCTPSIADQELLRITSTRTWASPTPQCEELSVGAWCLLKELASTGAWGVAAQAWRAAVIPEMSLLRRAQGSSCFLVLCSTTWGCLVWPSHLEQESREARISMDDAGAALWLPVCDWKDFTCLAWKSAPPRSASGRVTLSLTGEEHTPLVAAAHVGFRHFTEPVFDAVVKDIGADLSQMPKARIEKLFWLMRQVLSGLTEPEIASIMAASWFNGRAEEAELAKQGNLAIGDAVLDDRDRKDFQDYTKNKVRQNELDALAFVAFLSETGLRDKYPDLVKALGSTVTAMARAVEEQKKPPVVGQPSSRDESSTATGGQGPQKPVATRQRIPPSLDLIEWRGLLPKCTGCVGQIYEKSRSAQVYYPGASPASRSRTWSSSPGQGFSRQQVLVHCLLWAWHHHKSRTGEDCPHDIGGMADLSALRL